MKKTIVRLKNGQTYYFPNTAVQSKDGGAILAVFDCTTYRIIAEFKAELVLACGESDRTEREEKALA